MVSVAATVLSIFDSFAKKSSGIHSPLVTCEIQLKCFTTTWKALQQ